MTERYELAYELDNWWAVRDGAITLWKEEVVDLLNEQEKRINELEKEKHNIIQTIINYYNEDFNGHKKDFQSLLEDIGFNEDCILLDNGEICEEGFL